ncbi:DUF2239 family protein [Silvimonas amylolytica]|uniref:DUF2239 domain-containing protein n=1 Tax=Silvimonas amylolytica TaxID=449663 RepID=A0ABQ2PKT9_9NEIS|nr:DUF2239 family protein [Silvimonas amylolytica]GGP25574.1 hypothetical protein GCM10010971_13930 [Silvimonas amylolytica]
MTHPIHCTAFVGHRRIASGLLRDVAIAIKESGAEAATEPLLVFDDITARPVELDLRGTAAEIAARIVEGTAMPESTEETDAPRGRGRPKLGVVAREVTLLPRHWEWLNSQPGGASVVLRKLVDAARHASAAPDRRRHAQEVCYRFISALAGNLAGFEEVSRALFAPDQARFETLIAAWPQDVREYATKLAEGVWA